MLELPEPERFPVCLSVCAGGRSVRTRRSSCGRSIGVPSMPWHWIFALVTPSPVRDRKMNSNSKSGVFTNEAVVGAPRLRGPTHDRPGPSGLNVEA